MNNHGRWRIGALASAIALLGSLASLQAHALALGRITVQSALGEPLRAEIDISDINAEEASSLRAGVAPAEAFKAAGFEYTAAVAGLEIRLQRRADGRPYLSLSSSRAITEPFVDLILETNWSAGRITRDYTMLFDPPKLRAAANMVEPAAALVSRAPAPSAAVPAREAAPSPYPPATPAAARSAPLAKAPAIKSSPAEKMPVGNKQLVVRPGDTASRIAARSKPSSVSLDQMLAALLRSNPDAFIGGNINIIKSGAVLDIPGTEAASVLPGEARTMVAQSKDFNVFRRKLAEGAAPTQVVSAERQVGGKVQTTVEDRALKPATPDKLTLSSGVVQAKAATPAEEKIAIDRSAKDTSSRVADLSKNISDLNKLGTPPTASSGSTLPAPALNAPSGITAPAITPAPVSAAASAAGPGADMAAAAALLASSTANGMAAPFASASEPAFAASAAVVVAPVAVKKPAVAAPVPQQTGLFDQAFDNPLLLLGAGGLLVLLGGLIFARYRKNKKMGHVDSSFLESRLQPDSFFGASGGQRIDTSENNAAASSVAYTPSQFDAAGDVDPVAEADVYLAYGRDQQAEEILKEAMRSHPARVAIHAKLVEIYAKRRDSKAFDSVALEAFRLTQGKGPEWAYIIELGRDLNPANPMYRPGAVPAGSVPEKGVSTFPPVSAAAPLLVAPASTQPLDLDFSLDKAPDASMTPAASIAPVPHVSSPGLAMPSAFLDDLDLDLDMDLDSVPAALTALSSPVPVPAMPSAFLDDLDLDLDMDLDSVPAALTAVSSPVPVPALPSAKVPSPEIDFLSGGLDFTPDAYTAPQSLQVRQAPGLEAAHSGMLEFDLSSLSLDLGPTTQAPPLAPIGAPEDPLEIKFLLAEEFRILGDSDGARSLADEVLVKARGPLKVKAQAFLNTLS